MTRADPNIQGNGGLSLWDNVRNTAAIYSIMADAAKASGRKLSRVNSIPDELKAGNEVRVIIRIPTRIMAMVTIVEISS